MEGGHGKVISTDQDLLYSDAFVVVFLTVFLSAGTFTQLQTLSKQNKPSGLPLWERDDVILDFALASL